MDIQHQLNLDTSDEIINEEEISTCHISSNNVLPEGLYEYSDDWIARTGGRAFAKSGVGGGLLIVLPDICGIGIVSPPLDKHGNSVKGIAAGVKLSKKLAEPVFSKRTLKRKNKGKKKTRRRKKK